MAGERFKSVSVIGAGAWGSALASLIASNGAETTLWAREPAVVDAINSRRENSLFLPGVRLHETLRATPRLEEVCQTEAYVFVAPVQFARRVLEDLSRLAAPDAPIVLCSKGIEQNTGRLLTEVLAEAWPGARPGVLSGPSFARDVAARMPTAVTLAADKEAGARWVATIGAPHFRPYLSEDLIGAELGGAVKNVLAIAAGVVMGKGLGESARAAVVARGFAEFQRLGLALGAKRETMAGLSGLGDLVLTACSAQSRNFSLGFEVGRGASLDDILSRRTSVAEGVATASAVVARAEAAGVDMPISAAVADLVSGASSVDALIASLLARPFRFETDC
jgi:glycerol-3-phosphate dehydrogenase (NAD(P)+)